PNIGAPNIPAAALASSGKPTSGPMIRSAMRRPLSSPGVPKRRRRNVVAVEIRHRPRGDRRRAASPKSAGRDLSSEPPLPEAFRPAVRPCPSRRLGWGAQLRGQRQQQLFKNGRALPPGFASRARGFGGRPMSEHEALARFRYGYAARHHKVEIRQLWRSRYMMHAQRSPLTNILIRIQLLRRSRIYTSASAVGLRMVKEICNAARELAGFPAPFFRVLPDLFVAGDDTREIHSLAPGVATRVGRCGRGRFVRSG